MASSYTPTTFAAAVLKRVGAPVNRANLQALVGWQKAEGGHWNNDARFNPLNTTMPMPGAGNTGTQGNIKQYTSWDQGLAATVKTLKNGLYGNILGALKKGNNPSAVGAAVGNSPWCPGCGAYATRVIQQTKIPGSVATRLSAQQGGLAQTVTPGPSTPLASAARAVTTPALKAPTTKVVQTSKVVEPDTSAQGFISQMAAQVGQGTTPAPQGGLDVGQSKYLSQAPVPVGAGGGTTPAPGVGAQLAGLSQLVGPSTFVGTKTVTTPSGQPNPTPAASKTAVTPPKKVTPAPSQGVGADRASAFANAHIGAYAESAGSNRGPQLDRLEGLVGMSGQPWCAMFATTTAVHGGAPKSARTAAVAYVAQWARAGTNGYQKGVLPVSMARKGDLIMRNTDHIGFVDGRTANGDIIVIEGNANGSGGVARRIYPVASRWTGIARPKYQR